MVESEGTSHFATPESRLAALRQPSGDREGLEGLPEYDETLAPEISLMTPEEIGQQKGELVLAWATVDAPVGSPRQAELVAGLAEFGYQPSLFQKAIVWVNEPLELTGVRPNLTDVLAMDGLMEGIHGDALSRIDLQTQLKAATKPDFQLGQKQLDRYGLIPLRVDDRQKTSTTGSEQNWGKSLTSTDKGTVFHYTHLDAPVGFALTHKGWPQAFVSLGTNGPDELVVCQIQGARAFYVDPDNAKKSIGDKPAGALGVLEWEELMINLAEELADELGMSIIRVIGSGGQEDNLDKKTYGPDENPLDDGFVFTPARAQEIYDHTPRNLGFLPDDRGNWFKPVGARLKEARSLMQFLQNGRYH